MASQSSSSPGNTTTTTTTIIVIIIIGTLVIKTPYIIMIMRLYVTSTIGFWIAMMMTRSKSDGSISKAPPSLYTHSLWHLGEEVMMAAAECSTPSAGGRALMVTIHQSRQPMVLSSPLVV